MIGMNRPKVINKAVMIGVVSSWTRSSKGPPIGTVVLMGEVPVSEGIEDVFEGKGASCRLVRDGKVDEPVRMIRSGEGILDERLVNTSAEVEIRPISGSDERSCRALVKEAYSPSFLLAVILVTVFPPPSAFSKSSNTSAPHTWAHSSMATCSFCWLGRRRYGICRSAGRVEGKERDERCDWCSYDQCVNQIGIG